jgi:hypothetical protein
MRFIYCPMCRRRLRLPEDALDRSLECPACGTVFAAKEGDASAVRRSGLEADAPGRTDSRPLPRHMGDSQTSASGSFFRPKPDRGTIRKTAALLGLVGPPLVLVINVFHERPGPWGFLGFMVLAVVIAPLTAALGAAIGSLIETGVSLLCWRPGQSLLLTLAGDGEEIDSDGADDELDEEETAEPEVGITRVPPDAVIPEPGPTTTASMEQTLPEQVIHCHRCGVAIAPGEHEVHLKSETDVVGAVALSRTLQMVLCPGCARKHESTGQFIIIVLGGLIFGIVFLGCAGCLVSPK